MITPSTLTRFSTAQVQSARAYWNGLQDNELYEFWQHYTTGAGKGMYSHVHEDTTFLDYLVLSAHESATDRC